MCTKFLFTLLQYPTLEQVLGTLAIVDSDMPGTTARRLLYKIPNLPIWHSGLARHRLRKAPDFIGALCQDHEVQNTGKKVLAKLLQTTYKIRNQNFVSKFYYLVRVGHGCVEGDFLSVLLVECE